MDFVVAVVDAVLGGLGSLSWYLFAFLLVLTPLVFIHELGHFLVARLFKVQVETFSIGFGREIFGWTDKHGTRWKISLLPLGGYVKFWGDDGASSTPNREKLAEIAASDKSGALANCFHFKPLWQRAAVVIAGPVANFILALLIFVVMLSTLGDVRILARVGNVVADGAAAKTIDCGRLEADKCSDRLDTRYLDSIVADGSAKNAAVPLAPGDVITRIDGDEIKYFDEIPPHVVLNADEWIKVEICRGAEPSLTVGGEACENGQAVTLAAKIQSTKVTDPYGNVSKVGQLGVAAANQARLSKEAPEGTPAEALHYYFQPLSGAAKAGFAAGDLITAVNGTPVSYFEKIPLLVQQSSGPEVTFAGNREGESFEIRVNAAELRAADVKATDEQLDKFGFVPSGPERQVYGVFASVGRAVERMTDFVNLTLTYIGKLVVGKGDPSQLSGPIGIAKAAGDIAKSDDISVSLLNLVYFAAVLSLSLGLINLFPIPMLDGGHLLYYAFEAVRGRPLGERAQDIGFRIGLALVLFLMVFATWNDLAK